MRKTPLLTATILAVAISGVPEFGAAMGSNNPTPPQSSKPSGATTTKHKTKNLLKAKDDLEKVRLICGTECKEYVALKEVIGGTRTY